MIDGTLTAEFHGVSSARTALDTIRGKGTEYRSGPERVGVRKEGRSLDARRKRVEKTT